MFWYMLLSNKIGKIILHNVATCTEFKKELFAFYYAYLKPFY